VGQENVHTTTLKKLEGEKFKTAWLDHKIVYDRTAQTNVGVAKQNKDNNSDQWYLNTNKWLYANYAEHCHDTGNRALSLRRFVNLLSDLAKNQLGLDIERERNRFGSYFVGLKIRTEDDDKPPMITGERKCHNIQLPRQSNPNIINRVWTMVLKDTATHMMDKITTAIERIIDDGLGSESEAEVETETKQEQSRSPERESNVETQSSNEICVGIK
jgi:putative DNA primase/helicase